MNNKISKQAQQYADEKRPGSFVKYDPHWFAFYDSKLAELIVKECAEVAYKKHQPLAGKFIKEHFGVE